MNFEDTKWFKLLTGFLGFAATWWLFSLVHLRPFGSGSAAAFAIFGFCLFGVGRFVDMLLVFVVLIVPVRRDSSRLH